MGFVILLRWCFWGNWSRLWVLLAIVCFWCVSNVDYLIIEDHLQEKAHRNFPLVVQLARV